MSERIERVVTSGTFSLDGETHEVENNIWVVGDDDECIVIDAPHDVEAIMAVVGERSVRAILLTHAHDDHVRVAPRLRSETGAPIYLHPDDRHLASAAEQANAFLSAAGPDSCHLRAPG